MSTLILKPGQDPFHRNYLGTSLVSRNNILYTRIKEVTKFKNTTKRQNIHRIEKTTWQLWKSLLTTEQETFNCYHLTYSCLHSGYHVFSAVNTFLNYSKLNTFDLIRTISLPPSKPHTPNDFELTYYSFQNYVLLTWLDDYSPPIAIRAMLINTYSSTIPPTKDFTLLDCKNSDNEGIKNYLDPYNKNSYCYYYLQAIDDEGLISDRTNVLFYQVS